MAVNGWVRFPICALTFWTCSAVISEALLPQLCRMKLSTAARSSSDRLAPRGGIVRFHSRPLTETGPLKPINGIGIMWLGLPCAILTLRVAELGLASPCRQGYGTHRTRYRTRPCPAANSLDRPEAETFPTRRVNDTAHRPAN